MSQNGKGSPLAPAEPSNGGVESEPPDKSPKTKKQAWRATADHTLALLHTRFPACFAAANQAHRQPIKIGIHGDIAVAAPDLSPAEIGRALTLYVHDSRYLLNMVAGRTRIDLNGQCAGAVTGAQAELAAALLAKRVKRPATSPSPKPERLSLAALKEAAAKRKLVMTGT